MFRHTLIIVLILSFSIHAQDHENIRQVSRSFERWDSIRDVKIIDNYAYLSTSDSGLRIIDISDTEHPVEVNFLDIIHSMRGIAIQGNYAYVTARWDSGGHETNFLYVLDISDIVNPDIIYKFDIGVTSFTGIGIGGNLLAVYLSSEGIMFFDISNPMEILQTGFAEMEANIEGDFVVENNLIYAADTHSGLLVLDYSNPPNLETVATLRMTSPYSIAKDDNYLYISEYNAGNVKVVDVSDPQSPQLVSDYNSGYLPRNLALANEKAFICNQSYGLQVLDISNPESLELISTWDTGNRYDFWDVLVRENIAYLAKSRDGFRIVDFSDPEEPVERGLLNDRSEISNLTLQDGFLFLADRYSGITIADISDPENPEEISTIDLTGRYRGIMDIFVTEQYLYAVDCDSGLSVIDITDVEIPRISVESCHLVQRNASCIIVRDNLAYIAVQAELIILDISDPDSITEISSFRHPAGRFVLAGNTIFMGTWRRGMVVIDVSNPRQPALITTYNEDEFRPVYLALKDNYLFTMNNLGGIVIFDVSNREFPVVVRTWENERWIKPSGIEIIGDNAFVSYYQSGISVMNISDPLNPHEIGFHETPGLANAIISDGRYIYLADGYNLSVFDCEEALSISEEEHSSPQNFSLFSAFPNPFNSTTSIAYLLPVAGVVSLTVFDLSGREVARLVDGLQTSGAHEAVWTADGVSSGVYVVALDAGGAMLREKVVLLR